MKIGALSSTCIFQSVVAMRMINEKSLDILTDAMQKIEDGRSSRHSSSSDSSSSHSSKTHSTRGSVENLHKLNEAEESVSRISLFHLDQL